MNMKTHHSSKTEVVTIVDSGAWKMAINVLERAGKHEIVEELKKSSRRVEMCREDMSTDEWVDTFCTGPDNIKSAMKLFVKETTNEIR